MDFNRVIFVFFLVALGCPVSDARSFKATKHKVTQIQPYLWEDSCPPMAFQEVEIERNCTDTCHTHDYCTGRQLCCLFNGCKTCMEPVLPPAVIDWLGGTDRAGHFKRYGDGDTDNTIILTEPHYDEVECVLDGKTYTKGVFYQGCRKCFCNIGGYITCELRCKGDDKKIPNDDEASGSGDEGYASSGNPPIKKEHLNQLFPVSYSEVIEKKSVRPKPVHFALDQPQPEIVRLQENSGDNESVEDESEQNGSGDDNNEMLKQRFLINQHKMTASHRNVNEVSKIGDIFLVK